MANSSPHRETERHRAVFEEWYAAGRVVRPILHKVALPERTFKEWIVRYGWHARADARDAEIAKAAEREAIKRRADMLKRHRQGGELAVRRAIEHLSQRKIERTSDALNALTKGIDIERTAEGLPAWYEAVSNADDEQLAIMERALVGAGAAPDAGGGAAPDEGTGACEAAAAGDDHTP